MDIINEILKYKSLSIIGNYKNVGKTTSLNYIINKLYKKKAEGEITLGLTSIGMDGEDIDLVTKSKKPRIYIKANTIVATAKSCVLNSDITKEILEVTNINTPLGNVVIFRALSDGYIQLAGPSINSQIKYILKVLKNYGATLNIVDGALSRKTLGSPNITEATIFCSGAVINKSINKVIETISYEVNLLTLNKIEDDSFYEIYENIKDYKVSIINNDYKYKNLEISTTLDAHIKIYNEIDEKTKYIFINGTLTNILVENIIKNNNKYKNATLVVVDSTKIFLDKEVYDKFIKQKGKIRVVKSINLIGVSINPTSIDGYSFNEKYLINSIKSNTKRKVFNVKSESR